MTNTTLINKNIYRAIYSFRCLDHDHHGGKQMGMELEQNLRTSHPDPQTGKSNEDRPTISF